MAAQRKPQTVEGAERLFIGEEVDAMLGCGPTTRRRLVQRGLLRPVHLGPHQVRYRASDVSACLDALTDPAPGPKGGRK